MQLDKAAKAAKAKAHQRALVEALREMAQPVVPVAPDWDAERRAKIDEPGRPGLLMTYHPWEPGMPYRRVSFVPLVNGVPCGAMRWVGPQERSLDPAAMSASECAYKVAGRDFDHLHDDIYVGYFDRRWETRD